MNGPIVLFAAATLILVGLFCMYVMRAICFKLARFTRTVDNSIPDLKDTLIKDFGDNMICGTSLTDTDIDDRTLLKHVEKHFNAVTLANELKPVSHLGFSCGGTEEAVINGQTITVPILDYSIAEKYLDFFLTRNEEHPDKKILIRGHVLVWHKQTPKWFFHEDYDENAPYVSPEVMTLRQEWYIKSILEHYMGADSKYKNLFYGWDVVNEAVSDETDTYRTDTEGSPWWAVYRSSEYIINAFRFANRYCPGDVELYYNDYDNCIPPKVDGIAKLLMDVKSAEGVRIDGMGMQGHYKSEFPTADQFVYAASRYGSIVGKIMLSEVDFKADPAYDGTAASRRKEYLRLAYRYKTLYDAMKKVASEGLADITGFTVWGVADGNSWITLPVSKGGTNKNGKPQCPLLFDDRFKAKPAYWAIVDPDKLERYKQANP